MMRESRHPFVFASEILGSRVTDTAGRRLGKIVDLVASAGEPYPSINGLLIRLRQGSQKIAPLPANQARTAARDSGPAQRRPASGLQGWLKSGRHGFAVDPASLREYRLEASEFLVRDLLLDQQIVDVEGAKVERVNDVQILLAERPWIVHVDVGLTGLLRRLGFEGFLRALLRPFGRPLENELISWKFVQPLAETNEPGRPIRLKVEHARIHDLHPGEMADILEDLGRDERAAIVHSLGPEAAADALEEAEDDVQAAVISQLDPEVAADILEEMDPGEAADILTSLPDAHSEQIIAEVDEPEREQLEQLIAYEEKTAAALMTPEFVSVGPEATAEEALAEVRRQAAEIEAIYYVYVLSGDRRLIGVTTLRSLFRCSPGEKVSEIMETRLVTVKPEAEPREVAEIFLKYSFLGCPVVDPDEKMLGVILIKHAFDELLPEFRREAHA